MRALPRWFGARLGRARVRVRPSSRVLAYLALGAVAYLLFLVARWPAAHAWEMLGDHAELPRGLEVAALEGTVWSGQARGVGSREVRIDRVGWEVEPASLLRGRLRVAIDGAVGGGSFDGRVEAGVRSVRLLEAQGQLPVVLAERPASRLSGLPLGLDGTLAFAVDRLTLERGGDVTAAEGRLAWHDAAVAVDERVELGGLTSELDADDGELVGRLGDTGGNLFLDGSWRLAPDGRYVIDAVADGREGAPEILPRSLEMVGPRAGEGVQLSLEGRL